MSGELQRAVDTGDIRARFPGHFEVSLRTRAIYIAITAALVGLFVFGLMRLGFESDRLVSGLKQIGFFMTLMLPPDPGPNLMAYLSGLEQTLSIAFLGTSLAALLAFPLSLLAARNVMPAWIFRFLTRRFLDTARGIDTLIWALIWISVVGLGPFAGVLAIASSDFGAFGKLFSEAFETADRKPVEGIRSTGGTRLHEIRFGLIPQILPVIAGQVLYFFESNTRSATIIGIVGAGGIGLQLSEEIRTLEWQHVSFIIMLILVLVAAIDQISSRLRFAIIGKRAI